uniref:TadE/TadG family type IV pilus assembly protein n=1 Tax=Umezakia ovalisporum TaxID=75695 RepID=UPI0039C5E11F
MLVSQCVRSGVSRLNPKRFVADRRGNIAVIFALASLPVALAMGAAVDYSQRSELDSNIQDAADAAVLAAARAHDKSLAQKKELADRWFKSSVSDKSGRLKNIKRQLVQLKDGLRYTV